MIATLCCVYTFYVYLRGMETETKTAIASTLVILAFVLAAILL